MTIAFLEHRSIRKKTWANFGKSSRFVVLGIPIKKYKFNDGAFDYLAIDSRRIL